jgi:DNA-binding NarL/FixJ family response regulator
MSDKKIAVLLVDDHAVVRNGVKLMLSAEQDIVIAGEASNAQDAMKLVQAHDFNVALVDIAMPGKNGLDLLRMMHAEKPKLAVLMLSTYSEEIYAVRAFKLGAAGYLTKDSPTDVLVAAIRKAAGGGRYVTPSLMEKLAGMLGGEGTSTHENLTNRELEILKLIASGESLVKIANTLHISPNTVTTYRTRILEKMGMASNAELTRYAIENGLLI